MKRHADGDPAGIIAPRKTAKTIAPPLVIEDVEWMVETGESLTQVARRVERSVEALWKALNAAGRRDLYRALAARECDWNTPTNRAAIVRQKRTRVAA